MAPVQGLAEHGFDEGLAADVEFFGGGFEFFEHGGGEVDVDALDGFHHFAGVGEEAKDVFAVVGHAGDGFGGDWLFPKGCFLHRDSNASPGRSSLIAALAEKRLE